MIRSTFAAGCVAALLTLTACSSSGGGSGGSATPPPSGSTGSPSSSAPTAAAAKADITIKDFGFAGKLTVTPGEKVTVVNEDGVAHTLTDKVSHKFDTGTIAGNGGKGTFTAPSKPGSYPFGCTFHPEMKGTLVVKG